ncbi:MAG TPA: hypothetical protein VE988_28865 [Gemmataceae bacterium]|nr:hypothetical protein [Gemmataceae bacterium]
MLRIECSCGKILKVNETLIGKKIKCPGCAAIQLVKNAPSTATAASSKAAPQAEEHMAPVVKKKSPVAAAPKSPLPQKRRFREDHEDDEELPPRKKSAKKGGNKMLLLLVGGGAFVVLLAVVAVGAWFLLSGDDKKVAVTPPNKNTGPGPKSGTNAEAVAIKFFVPHKVGDRREFKVVGSRKVESKWQDAEKLPPEFLDNVQGIADNSEDKTALKGTVTTLAVNDKGEETKVELALTQIKIDLYKDGKDLGGAGIFPEKAVVFGTRDGSGFVWTDAEGGFVAFQKWLRPCLADEYMDLNEIAADEMFGAVEKKSAGDTWPVNKAAIDDTLKKKRNPKAGNAKEVVVVGTGELRIKDGFAKFLYTSEAGDKHLDVEIHLDWALVSGTRGLEKRDMNFIVSLPRDGTTGPVKKAFRLSTNGTLKMPLRGYGRPKDDAVLISSTTETVTTSVKYLGKASGADKTQKPKDKGVEIGGGTKEQKPPPKGDGISVKLTAPYKVGDQREIHLTQAKKTQIKLDDESKVPPEVKAAMLKQGNKLSTATIHGIVTTLEIDDKGQETKVLFELQDIDVSDPDAKGPLPAGAKGAKVIGTRDGLKFKWSQQEGGLSPLEFLDNALVEVVSNRYLDLPTDVAERVFGLAEKKAIGETWPVDKDALFKAIKDSDETKGGDKTKIVVKDAKGKLAKSGTVNGKDVLQLEFGMDAIMEDKGIAGQDVVNGTVAGKVLVIIPADGSSGPLKKTTIGEATATFQLPLETGKTSFKVNHIETTTQEIKYLGQAPKLDPPTTKETKTPKGDAVAIKLFVPHKKGDVREVKFSAEVKVDLNTPDLAKLPEETKTLLTSANVREKITLHAKVQTLEVNELGEETKVSLMILGGDIKETGAQKHFGDNPVVPKSAVIIGVRNGTSFDWSIPGGTLSNDLASYLSTLVSNKFLEQPEITSDKLFGTDQKQVEGGAWPINKALLEKINQQAAMKDPGGGPDKAPQVDGSGKLFQIVTDGGKRYLDVEIKAKMSVSDGTFVMATENKLRLPDDGSTGPLKRAEKMTMSVGQAVSLKVPAGQPPIVTTLTTVTEYYTFTEITYLGNFPVKDVK